MKKTLLAILTGMVPVAAYASGSITGGITSLGALVNAITSNIITALITLFATGALAAFFFGMVKFILAAREGKPEEIDKGKKFMLWGVIALFVMFSVWGIVRYAQTIFGVTSNTITIPKIIIDGSSSGPVTPQPGLPTAGPTATVGANCTTNAECGTTLVCRNFTCQQPTVSPTPTPGPSATVGANCTTNAECGSSLVCTNFTCQSPTDSYGSP